MACHLQQLLSTSFAEMINFLRHKVASVQIITACAVATSCCISDMPSQWEGQNFDPPQLPHFQPLLMKLKTKNTTPGTRPRLQNLVDVGRREKGLRREGIFGYFLCFILYTRESSYCFQRVLAIAIPSVPLFVRPSVRQTGGSGKNGAS